MVMLCSKRAVTSCQICSSLMVCFINRPLRSREVNPTQSGSAEASPVHQYKHSPSLVTAASSPEPHVHQSYSSQSLHELRPNLPPEYLLARARRRSLHALLQKHLLSQSAMFHRLFLQSGLEYQDT